MEFKLGPMKYLINGFYTENLYSQAVDFSVSCNFCYAYLMKYKAKSSS